MTAAHRKLDFIEASRSLLIYATGCGVLWCIWRFGPPPHQRWLEWVALNVVVLLICPVLFRAVFLDEGLSAYGLSLGDRRQVLAWSLGLTVAVMPVLVYASRLPEFQAYYPRMAEARFDPTAFAVYATSLVAYMFAWEYFYRGFLLFGLAKGMGPIAAIVLQAIPFGLSHLGKEWSEVYASFGAGVILGWVSWRCRSFVPAFVVHTAANLLFNLLVIRLTGTWL